MDSAFQFFYVVGSDSFAGGAGCQRSCQVQAISSATCCLIKIVFFLQQGVRGYIFEINSMLLQPHAFFMWIQPVSRCSERKATFDHAGNEDCAKTKAANVRSLQYAQSITIRGAN